MKALETLIFAETPTIFRDVTFYGPVAFGQARKETKSKLDMPLSKMKIHNLTVTHLYLRIQKLTSGK